MFKPRNIISLLLLLLTIPVILFVIARRKQQNHYQHLQMLQQSIFEKFGDKLKFRSRDEFETPSFEKHLAVIPNFLPAETFESLKEEIVQHGKTERTYLPTHKQGGTISYEELHQTSPQVVSLFNSQYLSNLFSDIVGEQVQPTPINDQSSCSLLFYTEPGDHINWHFDHNFYNGRHFTVLMPIVNEHNDNPDQLSSAELYAKPNGQEEKLIASPNTLIIFEGAKVLHKVTRLGPNETRIMLSMTFSTTPYASAPKEIARRIKDTAFFGVRALWT